MNDEEFRAVSTLEPGARYDHFVKRVADWQWVWVLEDDNGLVAKSDDGGRAFVAVWPHERYAEACATEEWAGAEPSAIEVHEWADERLPRLAEENLMTVVFPTPSHQGFVVPPLGMKEDLEEELSLYE